MDACVWDGRISTTRAPSRSRNCYENRRAAPVLQSSCSFPDTRPRERRPAFAVALGAQIFFLAQCEMDDPAFARRHGSEAVGVPVLRTFSAAARAAICKFLDSQRSENSCSRTRSSRVRCPAGGGSRSPAIRTSAAVHRRVPGAGRIRARQTPPGFRDAPTRAVPGDGRIDRDAVLQFEAAVEITACRNSPIFLAAATLSVMGIVLALSRQPSVGRSVQIPPAG